MSDKQKLVVSTNKARELVRRGVQRVLCLRVGKARLLEWSRATDDWRPLANDALLDDRCFARPLPVRARFEPAGDEAVVAALKARRVPALEALLAEGEAKGRAEGEARGLGPLHRQFERRLGRALTGGEGAELGRRLGTLGPTRLGDVVLDLAPAALGARLADPHAR